MPTIAKIGKDKELVLLVTNCAVNKKGEILDVVIKINNVNPYESGGTVKFSIKKDIFVLTSQKKPANDNEVTLDVGSPLGFALSAALASCDFTMTYYKTGTYDAVNDKGILGNITLINGFFYDIDIPTTSYPTKMFKGSEGLYPTVGSSVIYYNKNNKKITDYSATMQEGLNGLAIKTSSTLTNVKAAWFATSMFMLTDGIKDSEYKFTYGGKDCGITYFFASPYPYSLAEPVKNVSVKETSPGKNFNYEIMQYIPNDYYGNLFNFGTIYPDLAEDSKLTDVVIKDEISDDLIVDEDRINVTTETKDDVTDLFDIVITDNYLAASAKKNVFDDPSFYNHTYFIHVPVTLKENVKGLSSIKNVANTSFKRGEENENLSSNETEVIVKYKLMVNYIDKETNEKIAESEEEYLSYDEEYKTNYSKVDKDTWDLVDVPNNASGKIAENTEVNYYFSKHKESDEPIVDFVNPDTGFHGGFVKILIGFILIIYLIIRGYKKIYKL